MKNKLIVLIALYLLCLFPINAKAVYTSASINNHPDSLVARYKVVAQNLASIGLFNEALDSLNVAIDLCVQSDDKANYIQCNELFANNLTYLGRYEDAIQIGLLLVDYCSSVYGDNTLPYYNALQNLATYYSYAGDYKHSNLYNQYVLSNCNDEYLRICAKENLAIMLMRVGDNDTAIQYMNEALDYFMPKKDYSRIANLHHNIGNCYAGMNNLLNAIRHELNAMSCLELLYEGSEDSSALLESNPLYNRFRHMLAVYYAKLQVYDVALSQEENVLDWVRITQGENSIDYINSLASLAYMYKSDGKTAKWEELTVKAYELCMAYHRDNTLLLSETLERMVEVENSKQNRDSVADLVIEATRLKKEYLLHIFSGLTDEDRRNVWDKEYYWFENTIPQLAIKYKSESLNSELYNSILFFKGLLLQSSKSIKSLLNDSLDPEIARQIHNIQESHKQIAYLEESNTNKNVLDSLKAHVANQERLLLAEYPEIEDYFRAIDINWRNVQAKLSQDDISVEFFTIRTDVDSYDYYTVTITPTCDSPQVDFVCSSSDIDTVKPEKSISNDFAELIWGGIARKYSRVKRIFFSPAGLLNSYPIEYLTVPNNTKCNKYRLSSTRELAINRMKGGLFSSAVLFGGIDFNSDSSISTIDESGIERTNGGFEVLRGGVSFNLLPGTNVEVNSIANILRNNKLNVTLLTGDRGTESSLVEMSGRDIPIIHIATHGFYYTGRRRTDYFRTIGKIDPWVEGTDDGLLSMQLSALLFAGGNKTLKSYELYQESNNGILTAEEASRLTLDNTRLLVLSACQTALGEITNEGVIGIQRGFKMAGVQSVIMSLWEVDDDATCYLMELFYSNLIKLQDPYAAFNKAINKMKSFKGKRVINGISRQVDYTKPYYWSAFVLIDSL